MRLFQLCKDTGADSVRTEAGLFYRTTRQSYWTSDWESMGKFIVENNVPELLEKRIQQTNMKQFLEEHPELAADPKIAAEVAVEFWKSRVQGRVTDFKDVDAVTKPINKGLNGLKDRLRRFKEYMKCLG